jgi:hypothetical protein
MIVTALVLKLCLRKLYLVSPYTRCEGVLNYILTSGEEMMRKVVAKMG